MRVVAFRARFSGLYAWGAGWLSDEKEKAWNSYFERLNDKVMSHWRYFYRDGFSGSQHLVCVSGSLFLHPMDVSCVIQNTIITRMSVDGKWVETFPEIDELKEILAGAAEACGGSVRFSDVVASDIAMPSFEEEVF